MNYLSMTDLFVLIKENAAIFFIWPLGLSRQTIKRINKLNSENLDQDGFTKKITDWIREYKKSNDFASITIIASSDKLDAAFRKHFDQHRDFHIYKMLKEPVIQNFLEENELEMKDLIYKVHRE